VLKLFRGMLQWRKDGNRYLPRLARVPEGAAFLKSDPGLDRPDFQLHSSIGKVEDHMRKIPAGAMASPLPRVPAEAVFAWW